MATTIPQDYTAVLNAIGDYYGVGSDQWVGFSKYGLAYQDIDNILDSVPGVTVYQNNAGQITGYSYSNPFSYSDGGVAGEINSNVQQAAQANGNTFKSNIPASGTINQQTGNAELSSGAKSVATGSTVATVLDKVALGIVGVSLGCKLGAFIDGAIYNSDPDYWDRVCPTINPQTWDSIAKTEFGKSHFNALFGIDKATGNTQMYIPEDVAAYMAYMMSQEGFFSSGGTDTASIDDTTGLRQGIIDHMPYNCGSDYSYTGIYNSGWTGSDPKPSHEFSGTDPIYFYTISSSSGSPDIRACSKSTFSGTMYSENEYGKYSNSISPSRSMVNNKPVYLASITNVTSGTSTSPSAIPYSSDTYFYDEQIAYIILYGTITSNSGKEGVEKQDGATFPNTQGWTGPAAVDASLRQQYPEMYNNAIYTDVPQKDGTTTRIKYIPINTTGTSGSNDTAPTNTATTYNQTTVNQNSDETLLKTIIRYLTGTQSDSKTDTPQPPDTPNPTDTGTGDTPTIVMPTGSASALWSVYNPSQAQLNSFGAWLWSSNFIDQILKLFNNPMQSIIGVHKIFATPATSGSGNITVGYLDSGVSANLVSNQYTDINCGYVNVREQFGNVFDYTDTHIRLYLPFIGIVDLDTADVMRGTVKVVYHVDVITGACLAEVKISRDASGGTLYQFAGDAAVRYPISSGSYMGVVSGILSAVGGVASAVMTGGATLPLAAGAVAGGISGAHTQVQHSGNFSGNAGAMGGKKPYIIIERPQSYIADDFKHWQGLGANTRRTVGQMSGYFKFSDVHTESISKAAESEIEAIRAALESGVIA